MQSRGILGLDVRSLGLFRIIIGLNMIYNYLYYRLFDIDQFYGPHKIQPDGFEAKNFGSFLSFLDLLHSNTAITIFFLVAIVLAVLFMIGYRPKITGALSLLCWWSMIHSSPMLTHGPEFLIEISLFWTLFLPINSRFSLFPTEYKATTVNNLPAYALLFQIGILYFTSTVTKNGEFWREGVAVLSVMGDLTHKGMISGWLEQYPGLCTFLNYFTLFIEGIVPFLLFFPLYNKYTRIAAAVMLAGLHISLGISMRVGPFYYITVGYAVMMLPGLVWDKFKIPEGFNFRKVFTKPLWTPNAKLKRSLILVRNIFLWLMMIFIFQKNFVLWGKQSYLSDAIKRTAPLEKLADLRTFRISTGGLFNQSWWLFAPDPYKDMGVVVVAGISPNLTIHDIYTGRLLFQVEPGTQSIKTVNLPEAQFVGSKFVYNFYYRRYFDDVDPSSHTTYLQYEIAAWKKKNPDHPYTDFALLYFSYPTSYKNGKIERGKSVLVLANIKASGESTM